MSVVEVSNEVLLEGSVGDVSVGVSLENEGVSTSMFVGLAAGSPTCRGSCDCI